MQKITIATKDQDVDIRSDEVKGPLQSHQFIDTELARLQAQADALQSIGAVCSETIKAVPPMPFVSESDVIQVRPIERDVLVSALTNTAHPYITERLSVTPVAQHDSFIAHMETHISLLADFCLTGYRGAGSLTTEFIRALHQSLYPKDYRHEVRSFTDERHWMVPGQYKSINNAHEGGEQPHQLNVFYPPEQVPRAMEKIVDSLNIALTAAKEESQKEDAICYFSIDFLAIHPFLDANGRVACILADLLAIREGLPPFDSRNNMRENKPAVCRAIEVAQRSKNLTLAREVFEQYRVKFEVET